MILVTDCTTTVLDQEIDTVVGLPGYPDHVVVGTYSLIRESSDAKDPAEVEDDEPSRSPAARIGSVQILHVLDIGSTQSIQENLLLASRLSLPCAILDIRFCPGDGTLLCAATSIGDLRFFRILPETRRDSSGAPLFEIISLGAAKVYEDDDDGVAQSPPLITQFSWIDTTTSPIEGHDVSRVATHFLATCDTAGEIRLIEITIPSHLPSRDSHQLFYKNTLIHKHLHNLEAWTVAVVRSSKPFNTIQHMFLSGGDDSCLIASNLTFDAHKIQESSNSASQDESTPIRILLDRQTHAAGVVAILPLPGTQTPTSEENEQKSIPILTGSYDQYIRLILFDSNILKFAPVSEFELEGGVWRIALMETYKTTDNDGSTLRNHILLISCMHAGCYIIRLIERQHQDSGATSWDWNVEARFTKPHESMVYACVATKMSEDNVVGSKWRVLSTSFYDKRVCVWEWKDEVRATSTP